MVTVMVGLVAGRRRLILGFFGKFLYADGGWTFHEDGVSDPPVGAAYLGVDIHDSDIATVDFRPAEMGSGRFYLGYPPSDYFENESAGDPIDAEAAVKGLTTWAQQTLGRTIDPGEGRPLLADSGRDPDDDFVEETVGRLIEILGLPWPEDLPKG